MNIAPEFKWHLSKFSNNKFQKTFVKGESF